MAVLNISSKSEVVALDINGNHFEVELNDETLEEMDAYLKRTASYKEDVSMSEYNEIVYDEIEKFLGEDAIETIFEGEAVSALTLSKVLSFIFVEIKKKMNSSIAFQEQKEGQAVKLAPATNKRHKNK